MALGLLIVFVKIREDYFMRSNWRTETRRVEAINIVFSTLGLNEHRSETLDRNISCS